MGRGFDVLAAMGFGASGVGASQKAQIAGHVSKLSRQGVVLHPVSGVTKGLARTFWGKAWLDHLHNQADFASRLEKGRALLRADAVIHLDVQPSVVFAKVSAGGVYNVTAKIAPLTPGQRTSLAHACRSRIDTIDELYAGRLQPDEAIRMRSPIDGILPWVRNMDIECTCSEPKGMCRHVAAVLLGLASRFDDRPDLLFVLRQVDAYTLVSPNAPRPPVARVLRQPVLDGDRATPVAADVAAPPIVSVAAAPEAAATLAVPEVVMPRKKVQPAAPEATDAAQVAADAARQSASEIKRNRSDAKAVATNDLAPLVGKNGKPLTIEALDLLFMDIPRSTFQNWVAEGALAPSGERGTYVLTQRGQRRIHNFCDTFKAKALSAS